MQLDATTAEVVCFLQEKEFFVDYPIKSEVTDEWARVLLKGGHYAIVTRDDTGKLRVAVERHCPPVESLTHHDFVLVAMALENQLDTLTKLHAEVVGKPEFRFTARAYADDMNQHTNLRAKVRRILSALRSQQYAEEAESLI